MFEIVIQNNLAPSMLNIDCITGLQDGYYILE